MNLFNALNALGQRLQPTPSQCQSFSDHWRCINGSWFKILALLLMTIDHTAASIIWRFPFGVEPLFAIGSHSFSLYALMRLIGRLGFPMFAFLLVEGFLHTRSHKRYGRNLLLFAILSEIPWNLLHSGHLFFHSQNVFFTLFLGFLGMCSIYYLRDKRLWQAVALVLLLLVSLALRADYGCRGFGFIMLLYILRNNRLPQAIIGSCILPSTWVAGLAFIPLSMYNGKRGFIKGKVAKYLCYIYYPLHLFVIYLIVLHFFHPQ